MQDSAPASEKYPGTQSSHSSAPLLEYVPFSQYVQEPEVSRAYLPARHSVQFHHSFSLYRPYGHERHSVDASTGPYHQEAVTFTGKYWLPEEYFPAEHAKQVVAASLSAILPAAQSVQLLSPLALMRPASQYQQLRDWLFELLPASQTLQYDWPSTEYFPLMQTRQEPAILPL